MRITSHHWADGGLSDIDNAALLCERHHTVVHQRRLWAQVRSAPDELGRSVVWDLSPGSYDRHLEHQRRERAMHDPPPLSRDRLLELVAAITGDDDGDRRLAESDLTHYADAQYWAEADGDRYDPALRAWREERLATLEAVGHEAA